MAGNTPTAEPNFQSSSAPIIVAKLKPVPGAAQLAKLPELVNHSTFMACAGILICDVKSK
jgi:hypothetical protein